MISSRGRWILLAGAAALFGCAEPPPPTLADLVEPGAMAGRNLLLVTLDTTRPDHLGCYGDPAARTPNLDALAARGVLVEGAVTTTPVTLPAHASLLTGLYPPRHGVRDNGRYQLPRDGAATLAEQFQGAGYATAAVIGCFVLDARFGLDRGFDHYDFQATPAGYQPFKPDFNERDAREVTDAALAWLDQRAGDGRPFFLWVHYFDPHLPYRSPLMDDPEFADRPYAAEITHLDTHLGRLLARTDRDRTLIVAVGDHGESLGDHGEPTHGLFLYDSTVQVPLILSGAGLPSRPVRLGDRVVSLVDVRPTLEDLLGLVHVEPCDGVSLLEPADPARAVYLETEMPLSVGGWSPLQALRTRGEKFVRAPRPESYDLMADPQERRDQRPADPQAGAALEARLVALMTNWDEAPRAADRAVSDAEARRLASLGYVAGAGARQGGELPDPKDMIPVLRLVQTAEGHYAAGRSAEAIEAASEALRRSPDQDAATRVLAFSHLRLGDGARAVTILENACARQSSVYLTRSLAQVLIREQRYAEAEAALDRYAALAPDDGRVELLRGDICARSGDLDAARRLWRQAQDRDLNRIGPAAEARLRQLAVED